MLVINKRRSKYQPATLATGVFMVGFIISFGILSVIDPRDATQSRVAEVSQSKPKKEATIEGSSVDTGNASNGTANQENPAQTKDTATSPQPSATGSNPSHNQPTQATTVSQPNEQQEQDKNDSSLDTILPNDIPGV